MNILGRFRPPVPEPPAPKSPERLRLETLLGDVARVHPELDTLTTAEQATLTRHLLAGLRRLRELRPELAAEHDEIERFAFGATNRVRARCLTPVVVAAGSFEAGAVCWLPAPVARELSAAGFVVLQ